MARFLFSDPIFSQVLWHAIASVFAGGLSLGFVLLVLRLFRVKNPAIKYLFLAVPLAKSIFVLIREQQHIEPFNGVFYIWVQMLDPTKILPIPAVFKLSDYIFSFSTPSQAFARIPGLLVICALVTFFAWRFLGLMRFQRAIGQAVEFCREDHSVLFRIVDRLVGEAQIPYPKLIAVASSAAPFTVGIRRPIIALSPSLLDKLDEDELQAVVAHEIAHIMRKDYIFHWPLVIMRDVLFFNPMMFFLNRRLSFEKERACDDLGSRYCQPLSLAKSLLKIADLRRAEPAPGMVSAFAPESLISGKDSYFKLRVKDLIEPVRYRPPSFTKRLAVWLLFLLLIYSEIHVVAMIAGHPLVLG